MTRSIGKSSLMALLYFVDGLFSKYCVQIKKASAISPFFRRQRMLHNTIIQTPRNGEKKYVYYLSDDTNHDSVLTFCIIMDTIKNDPEVIEKSMLVACSDN